MRNKQQKKNKFIGGIKYVTEICMVVYNFWIEFFSPELGLDKSRNSIPLSSTRLCRIFSCSSFVGEGFGEKIGFSFILAIVAAIIMGVTLFATWGATQLFDVEFTVAYQIMTFGQCLCGSSTKDND